MPVQLEVGKIKVRLDGLSDIMFHRFIDHSKESRPPEQSLYLAGTNKVVLPAENIWSFLFGENPGGCAKTFEGKASKKYLRVGQGHVAIDPPLIPFLDGKGKAITFQKFDNKRFRIHEASPRVKSGSLSIKQEMIKRPVLHLPWSLAFTISLVKNELIDDTKLFNWFQAGGIEIALGNYRPRFGRFTVGLWET